MDESILNTIKLMLGIAPDNTIFDKEIVAHINAALMELAQIGAVKDGFAIDNETTIWRACMDDSRAFEAIKTCIYLRVKLLYDPPTNGSIIDTYNRTIDRLEWRLNMVYETKEDT